MQTKCLTDCTGFVTLFFCNDRTGRSEKIRGNTGYFVTGGSFRLSNGRYDSVLVEKRDIALLSMENVDFWKLLKLHKCKQAIDLYLRAFTYYMTIHRT